MLRKAFQSAPRRSLRSLHSGRAPASSLRLLVRHIPSPPFPAHRLTVLGHTSPTLVSPRQRPFSSPSSLPTSFADPDRSELFYHLVHPPDSQAGALFALSFLPDPPPSANSCAVLGWLPAEGSGEAGLNDFRENDKFREALHEAVEGALRDGVDEVQASCAVQTQQGWMHIHDNRNIPALGRIGDPDDIIASVRVEDGKILPDTYQPMPSYRLCTSDGVLQLTEGLFERLKVVLVRRVSEERGQD